MLETDTFIAGTTVNSNIIIRLPSLSKTQLGKILYISKSDSNPYSITIQPITGDNIHGTNTITQIYQTLMLINAGSTWYCIQIK